MAKKKRGETQTNGPSDTDIQAAYRSVSDAKREQEEATGRYRAALKAAKNSGVRIRELQAVMRDKREDHESLALREQERARYRQLFKLPTFQGELFGNQSSADDMKQAVWEAGTKGYNAGKRGDPVEECPYGLGSEEAVEWRQQWFMGQQAVKSASNGAKVASTRKRRAASTTPTELPN